MLICVVRLQHICVIDTFVFIPTGATKTVQSAVMYVFIEASIHCEHMYWANNKNNNNNNNNSNNNN